MIKFSLQCTPDALCYADHGDKVDKYYEKYFLAKIMTNIMKNMLIMTGSDGMNENRDDQFTSGRVPSLGKSSRPYGAKSLSKIANINTAFYSFFTSNSDYTNTETLTCPPLIPYHTCNSIPYHTSNSITYHDTPHIIPYHIPTSYHTK